MSYYTKFADVESLLTSTTTAVTMASTDAILVTSVSGGRPFQSTPGAVGNFTIVTTTTSTAVTLPPYGLSFMSLGTAGTTVAWLLQDPPVKGLVKTIFISSTTSTANTIATQGASIYTTANNSGVSVTIQGAGAGGVQLTSVSTSQWLLTGSRGTIGTS